MNILKLKEAVDNAIENAIEWENDPAKINVSIQIDREGKDSVFVTTDVELIYDGDGLAGGCVLFGFQNKLL